MNQQDWIPTVENKHKNWRDAEPQPQEKQAPNGAAKSPTVINEAQLVILGYLSTVPRPVQLAAVVEHGKYTAQSVINYLRGLIAYGLIDYVDEKFYRINENGLTVLKVLGKKVEVKNLTQSHGREDFDAYVDRKINARLNQLFRTEIDGVKINLIAELNQIARERLQNAAKTKIPDE